MDASDQAQNDYRYRNENDVQEKRNIAILVYGSLVNQRENQQTGARLESNAFAPTEITLPIGFLRKSGNERITAVISEQGQPKRVYFSTSMYRFLPNARNNLAAREGTSYRGQNAGYDLTNISYMKKLSPGKSKEENEMSIGNNWVMRKESNARVQLPENVARQIADWAKGKGFTAIIWAAFPANLDNEQTAARELIDTPLLLQNTKAYVEQLADGPQTAFERAVVAGHDALRIFIDLSSK